MPKKHKFNCELTIRGKTWMLTPAFIVSSAGALPDTVARFRKAYSALKKKPVVVAESLAFCRRREAHV